MIQLVVFLAVVAVIFVLSRRSAKPREPARLEHDAPDSEDARSPEEVMRAIDAFWAWWRVEGAAKVAAAIDANVATTIAGELGHRLHHVARELAWELGPGKNSRHHLALSAEGDPTLRVLAERWRSRAPAADATWEFYTSRQARPGAEFTLEIGGVELPFAAFRIGTQVDEARARIDVKVGHPDLEKLPEDARFHAALLFLDNLLGEDDVERWIGAIELSKKPVGAPPGSLAAAVDTLARATKEGHPITLLEGKTDDGRPRLASVDLTIKRIDHLLLDQHLAVRFEFARPSDLGLPSVDENREINDAEDELVDLLGHDAVWIARETGLGGRVTHFHAAATGPAEPRILEWIERRKDLRLSLESRPDPGWDVLKRW